MRMTTLMERGHTTNSLQLSRKKDSQREVERQTSAVFSVELEGMCSICNWSREKRSVLSCTIAFMSPQLLNGSKPWICS